MDWKKQKTWPQNIHCQSAINYIKILKPSVAQTALIQLANDIIIRKKKPTPVKSPNK